MDIRHVVLIAIPVVAFAVSVIAGPLAQSPDLYAYADQREFFGIPRFMDVVSNAVFLIVGALGLILCLFDKLPGARLAWVCFFSSIVLVSLGSVQYHLEPGPTRLVWDRLPIIMVLTSTYAAVLAEYVSPRLDRIVLPLAFLAGAAGVLYWFYDGDIAPYFAVQATVFLTCLYTVIVFKGEFDGARYYYAGFAIYVLALVCEQMDHQIFSLTGNVISGHSIKHVLAATSGLVLYRMLARRAEA